jgi:hypothetical protein
MISQTCGWLVALGLAAGALAACGSDDSSGAPASGGTSSGGAAGGGGTAGVAADGGACVRTPGPADGPRSVVVSHPYDAAQKPAGGYEVLTLDAQGQLAKTGHAFELGRAVDGDIVFTPDGELGFVATEDGKVGVFRFESDGSVTVLDPGFSGSFYAAKLVVDPKGDRLYVIDSQWRENGGGIYSLRIECDDSLVEEGQWAAAKLPEGLAFLAQSPGRVVVPASDILGSPSDQHVHLLDWSATPTLVGSASVFGSDSPIISSIAVVASEKYALIADNSGFSSVPNRIAVVSIAGSALGGVQELSPIEDPADIEPSPFDDTALVTSGFGDGIFVVSANGSASAPFSLEELGYSGDKPQLPVSLSGIRRGTLKGRVLVSEVSAVRQVSFGDGSAPTDLGPFSLGAGTENIVGALGVQP